MLQCLLVIYYAWSPPLLLMICCYARRPAGVFLETGAEWSQVWGSYQSSVQADHIIVKFVVTVFLISSSIIGILYHSDHIIVIISEQCQCWSYHSDHIRVVSRLIISWWSYQSDVQAVRCCGRPDVCCLVFVQHLHSITLVYMFVFILLLAHPVRHSLDSEENNNNPEYL